MTQRVAVLMKLREGVTKGEVKELCDLLRRIGDPEWLNIDESMARWQKCKPGPKTDEQIVKKYNDQHGDPVFYIP